MMNPGTLFVVVAFRCGGFENVFPIGVFSSRHAAEVAAAEHRGQRGGKYDHRIYPFDVNVMNDDVGHAGNNNACIEWTDNYRPTAKPVQDDELRQAMVQAYQIMSRRIADLELKVASSLLADIDAAKGGTT